MGTPAVARQLAEAAGSAGDAIPSGIYLRLMLFATAHSQLSPTGFLDLVDALNRGDLGVWAQETKHAWGSRVTHGRSWIGIAAMANVVTLMSKIHDFKRDDVRAAEDRKSTRLNSSH